MRTFAQAWSEVKNPPDRFRSIRVVRWDAFAALVKSERYYFVNTFVGSLMCGDAWLLKGAFPPEFMRDLIEKTIAWTRSRPGSFHKMLDGCPDFHRAIDLETAKLYSIAACKHSAYFFRWNDDPLGIWPAITERWRVLKKAMGMKPDEYESNKPSDGPTDRIQVVRYPPDIGYLEPHRDAAENQPCFISGYMSKRGVDYQGGGFYFVDEDGKARYAEDMIEVGDLCIGHANLLHGVAPADRGKPVDWDSSDGRWFLGLYSNESDYVQKRNTSQPIKVSVRGVLPDAVADAEFFDALREDEGKLLDRYFAAGGKQ